MLKRILVLAGLIVAPLHAETKVPTEQQLIDQIETLRLDMRRNVDQPQRKIVEMFQSIDRLAMPRAWIRAYQVVAFDNPELVSLEQLAAMQQAAEAQNDRDTLMYILWVKADLLKRQSNDVGAVLKLHESARTLVCGDNLSATWCGRTWRESAYLQYEAGEVVGGIDSIQNAIRILQDTSGPARVDYYIARQTYGLLLNQDRKLEESIRIEEENFDWFQKQGYWAEAAVAAYNVASSMVSLKPLPQDEALHYAEKTGELGRLSDDPYSMALADYLRGNIYLKTEQFEKAIPYYIRTFEQFKAQNNTSFMVRALIQKSRAQAGLHRTKDAEETLAAIDALQKIEHPMELLPVLKVREAIALQHGDYHAAHRALKQYQEVFEKRKTEEEEKGLQRMSTQLGLVLEKERNLKLSHQVEQAERLKIFVVVLSLLSFSTLCFAGTTLYQKRRARISHAKLQQVLDHVDLGLLTFDEQLHIDENYSRHLHTIVDHPGSMTGHSFVETVLDKSQLNGEIRSMVQEILRAVFGEKRLAWDLNADNFPSELVIEGERDHVFTLRWIPIYSSDVLKKVLLIMTDITQERELTKALGDQQKRMQALPDALREILATSQTQLLGFLEEADQLLTDDRQPIEVLRAIHTQKGVARSLGLFTLSNLLHEWESDVEAAKARSEVATQLRIYRTIAGTLQKGFQGSNEAVTLFQLIHPFLASWSQRLRDEELPLAEVVLADGVLEWLPEDLQLLRDCVVHGINNCLDHGFLFPRKRGEVVQAPRIAISAQKQTGMVRLEIRDNGVGIDEVRLRALADEKGFVPKNEETLLDILFWDGVSTADSLTITSGRGVGLAALKAQVQSRGGAIGIRNQENVTGTILWAEWKSGINQHALRVS